jgi:hypothetical protein
LPGVPTPQEYRRLLRQMDLPSRARLAGLTSRGHISDDPAEAALIAAEARRALRLTWWTTGLAAALVGLNLVTFAVVEDSTVRWGGLAVAALATVAIVVFLVRARLLIRTERLNRRRAGGGPQGRSSPGT